MTDITRESGPAQGWYTGVMAMKRSGNMGKREEHCGMEKEKSFKCQVIVAFLCLLLFWFIGFIIFLFRRGVLSPGFPPLILDPPGRDTIYEVKPERGVFEGCIVEGFYSVVS